MSCVCETAIYVMHFLYLLMPFTDKWERFFFLKKEERFNMHCKNVQKSSGNCLQSQQPSSVWLFYLATRVSAHTLSCFSDYLERIMERFVARERLRKYKEFF